MARRRGPEAVLAVMLFSSFHCAVPSAEQGFEMPVPRVGCDCTILLVLNYTFLLKAIKNDFLSKRMHPFIFVPTFLLWMAAGHREEKVGEGRRRAMGTLLDVEIWKSFLIYKPQMTSGQ